MSTPDPSPNPDPDNDPYRAPETRNIQGPATEDGKGSVGLGIGWFFLALIVGGSVMATVFQIAGALFSALGFMPSMLAMLTPLALPAAVGIWLTRKGQIRTAKGVWLGYAIVLGLALLLVAACFGLIASNGGLGNMH